MAPDSMMCNVAFAERGFNNSAREVFDLGIERLKSGQSAVVLFIEFAAKNLWIQFLGRCARMAQELPEISAAAKSSNWCGSVQRRPRIAWCGVLRIFQAFLELRARPVRIYE